MQEHECTASHQASAVDKGKVALSGFLYQTVAAMGIVAKAVSPLEDDQTAELNAFFSLEEEDYKEALFEYYDQDVALRSWKLDANSYALIQLTDLSIKI